MGFRNDVINLIFCKYELISHYEQCNHGPQGVEQFAVCTEICTVCVEVYHRFSSVQSLNPAMLCRTSARISDKIIRDSFLLSLRCFSTFRVQCLSHPVIFLPVLSLFGIESKTGRLLAHVVWLLRCGCGMNPVHGTM